jgi:hypothetical protein
MGRVPVINFTFRGRCQTAGPLSTQALVADGMLTQAAGAAAVDIGISHGYN